MLLRKDGNACFKGMGHVQRSRHRHCQSRGVRSVKVRAVAMGVGGVVMGYFPPLGAQHSPARPSSEPWGRCRRGGGGGPFTLGRQHGQALVVVVTASLVIVVLLLPCRGFVAPCVPWLPVGVKGGGGRESVSISSTKTRHRPRTTPSCQAAQEERV